MIKSKQIIIIISSVIKASKFENSTYSNLYFVFFSLILCLILSVSFPKCCIVLCVEERHSSLIGIQLGLIIVWTLNQSIQ